MKRWLWELLHNCVAHPLMTLTFGAKWVDRFHDWTAEHAWPGDDASY